MSAKMTEACPHCGTQNATTASVQATCKMCRKLFFVPGGRAIRLAQMKAIREL